MANQSYLDPEDDDLLNEKSPYSSISDRDLLAPVNPMVGEDDGDDLSVSAPQVAPSRIPAASNPVKDHIAKKFSPQSYESDPLMQQFNQDQQDIQGLRNAQMGANQALAFGQIGAQLATGGQSKFQDNGALSQTAKQGSEMLHSRENDLHRRQQVTSAIEARKGREQNAAANRDMRKMQIEAVSGRSKDVADARTDRMLSALGTRFENDSVLKPSNVNLASLNKSKTMLENTTAPLTSQSVSDVEQDIASALSLRPGVLSEGKIRRTEIEDLNRKLGEFKQKWGNKMVDMRTEAPEIVDQLRKVNQILVDDYEDTIINRKRELVNNQKSLVNDDRVRQGLDRYLETGLKSRPKMTVQAETSFPKQIRKDGHIATVNSPEELREAMGEGWN